MKIQKNNINYAKTDKITLTCTDASSNYISFITEDSQLITLRIQTSHPFLINDILHNHNTLHTSITNVITLKFLQPGIIIINCLLTEKLSQQPTDKIIINEIYVINLDEETKKLSNMKKQLTFKRIPGVITNIKPENSRILTTGHHGCLLSHVNAIYDAINNNYEYIVILEDDVIINCNIKLYIQNICQKYRTSSFDICYLGSIMEYYKSFEFNKTTTNCIGGYAVCISKRCFRRIIDLSKKKQLCIDEIYNTFTKKVFLNDVVKTYIRKSKTGRKTEAFYNNFALIE